jgi:hypothetical protein
MAAKLTRLTHKIEIQIHIVAESCTICSSRSRRPVRKLLDKLSYKERDTERLEGAPTSKETGVTRVLFVKRKGTKEIGKKQTLDGTGQPGRPKKTRRD